MKNTFIALAFDFLNPWCWVGEKRLRQAMASTGVSLPVDYQACRSHPAAQVGMDYRTYRENRFGSQAKAHEEALCLAAAEFGISLDFSRIGTMPDTERALRLMQWQRDRGQCPQTLFEGVYHALFCEGKDINDPAALVALLPQDAEERQLAMNFLRSEDGVKALVEAERETGAWCGRLTPAIKSGETVISGAQPSAILATLLNPPFSKHFVAQ
ncbi:DsbA family protein [Pseudomonas sp. MWU13-2105]|uniref:DsbA family protein n=1 Tax=Pseudomonas sp. MWU13-2105 TaxID=2935074 RepID=UPI00200F55EB|nr:DsbA family protein [Pseudomonas sp. MWU13-2105]